MKKFALSIKGGVALGFGAIGVVRFLQENNLKPTSLGGSSSGAMVAAMYALGLNWSEMVEHVSKVNFYNLISLRSIIQEGSLVDKNKYRKIIESFRGDMNMEDLDMPLVIFVTDPIAKKRVYFTEGSVVDALMASSGYPPIFPPMAMPGFHGRKLVDGDFTPGYSTKELEKYGAEITIGIGFGSEIKPKQVSGNLLQRTILIQKLYSNILDDQNDSLDPADYEIIFNVKNIRNRFNLANVGKIAHRGYLESMRRKEEIFKLLDV